MGSTIPDEEYVAQGARILPDAAAVFEEAEMILGVKEPQPQEVEMLRPHHLLFTYLHLAPEPGADEGPRRVRRHLRGLRDGRRRTRPAAAARPDERGGRQDRDPGGRVLPRAPARRPRRAARRRARSGRRDRDDHRRRRGRPERGLHRDRHGGGRVRLRPQHRPPARARRGVRRARVHRLLVDARRRGDAAARRPRDRRGADPRCPRAVRGQARPARPDEAARRARGRVDRPGRLLRDLARRRHTRTPSTRSTG